HTRFSRDWSSDVCSSDLNITGEYIDEDGNKAYFSVIIDREDFKANFQPNLIAQGVEINYNKLTSSNWLSIITFLLPIVLFIGLRSEERRVGKECRYRL